MSISIIRAFHPIPLHETIAHPRSTQRLPPSPKIIAVYHLNRLYVSLTKRQVVSRHLALEFHNTKAPAKPIRQQKERQPETRVPSPRVDSTEPPFEASVPDAPQLIVESSPPRSQQIVESGNNMPRRLQRELQALQSDADHVDVPPARSTTSRTRSASSVSNMARALCTAAAIANCCVAPRKASARQFPLQMFAEMANAVLARETGELLEYRGLMKSEKYKKVWNTSSANEFGRLAQ